MLHTLLFEPQCAPPLPDLMLLDEEDERSRAAWGTSLADFAHPTSCFAASAPVPITAPARHHCRVASNADLVDSLESSATLLGSSLLESATSGSLSQQSSEAMRFVPVSPPPSVPQRELLQAQAPQLQQFSSAFAGGADALLYGGYGVVAEPQHYSGRPAHAAAAGASWDLPTTVPVPSVHAATQYAGGVHSQDMAFPFSACFGGTQPQAPGFGVRRSMSEDALAFANYRVHGGGAYERLAGVSEASMGSESSDEDAMHSDRRATAFTMGGLPASRSAPSVGAMALERSGTSRRGPAGSPTSLRMLPNASSPRTVCLKVKASRPRPVARPAAPATEGGGAGRQPARSAARRSAALASALADDPDFSSDSEDEGAPSGGASEERRSGGSHTSSERRDRGGVPKKKHNPWSLAETEGLVEGVRLLGPSKWAEIKKLGVGGIAELLTNRSAVDLKDKWRNLTRVAKLPKTILKARAHKSTSDIPLDLLLMVKELMDMSRE